MAGTQSPVDITPKLQMIAELSRTIGDAPLTTLSHHIDLDFLYEAYRRTRKGGAVGIDGQTAADFATDLEGNLRALLDALESGRYRAPPVRRVYIPKADGRQRPLGIPTFSGKVLQQAVSMVLTAVYEPHFHAHSCGWVIDADIQGYLHFGRATASAANSSSHCPRHPTAGRVGERLTTRPRLARADHAKVGEADQAARDDLPIEREEGFPARQRQRDVHRIVGAEAREARDADGLSEQVFVERNGVEPGAPHKGIYHVQQLGRFPAPRKPRDDLDPEQLGHLELRRVRVAVEEEAGLTMMTLTRGDRRDEHRGVQNRCHLRPSLTSSTASNSAAGRSIRERPLMSARKPAVSAGVRARGPVWIGTRRTAGSPSTVITASSPRVRTDRTTSESRALASERLTIVLMWTSPTIIVCGDYIVNRRPADDGHAGRGLALPAVVPLGQRPDKGGWP